MPAVKKYESGRADEKAFLTKRRSTIIKRAFSKIVPVSGDAWDSLPLSEKRYICKQGDLPETITDLAISEMNVAVRDQLYFSVLYLADCNMNILDALKGGQFA